MSLPRALDAYNIHLGCGRRMGFDGHKAHNGHVQRPGPETSETGVRSEQGQSAWMPPAYRLLLQGGQHVFRCHQIRRIQALHELLEYRR